MQERINKIKDYFCGMNIAPGDNNNYYIYVEVAFPDRWTVSTAIAEKANVSIIPNENHSGYYFYGDMSNGYDTIFDIIEANVKINIDAEAKALLFREKQNELKKLFEDSTIDLATLKTLEFKMASPRKGKLPKVAPIPETVECAEVKQEEPKDE